jgi:hypothetical protein
MNITILFNGTAYIKAEVPQGVNPDTILAKHPGCMILAQASSQEEADAKIQKDRDRHKPSWTKARSVIRPGSPMPARFSSLAMGVVVGGLRRPEDPFQNPSPPFKK